MWGTYYGYSQLVIIKNKELEKKNQKSVSGSK